MEFKFFDYSEKVKKAMEALAKSSLEEAAGEIEAQVKRNTPVGKVAGSQLKNSWTHRVTTDGDDRTTAMVGSPLEKALWIEFGTGEYALEGKGRKGGWYIPIGSGKGQISEAVVKAYGFKVVHGKNGMKYAHTYGMKPQRPLHKAYVSMKNKIIKFLQDRFKGGLS